MGGVAFINKSFQELEYKDYSIISFNTSRGKENEDLYAKRKWSSYIHFLKIFISFISFSISNKYKIANIFVTSNIAFVRDVFFILWLKLLRKKIIIHFHSKKYGEFFLKKNRLKYLSFFLSRTNKIIVLSQDHFNYFSQYFPVTKMKIIENFIDYHLYECDLSIKLDEFLYVGRLSEKKGFFDLIEAVRILKNSGIFVKINIIGTPENENIDVQIKSLIKQYELNNYFELYGFVDGEKKYNLYKRCKFFIFPSKFENSPVVIKEAIASKMALIVSNIEANMNILKEYNNYVTFKVSDFNDIAKKIILLLDDNQKVNLMMNDSSKILDYNKTVALKKIQAIFLELEK